jgi:hypothetical protein
MELATYFLRSRLDREIIDDKTKKLMTMILALLSFFII